MGTNRMVDRACSHRLVIPMTNPPMDNSAPHAVVTIYDLEGEPGVPYEVIRFYGDCLTSARDCAELWLRKQDFVPINVSGSAWEERGIGSKQATLEEM